MTGRSEFDKIPNAAAQTVHDLARANERLEREVAALREAATEARDALGKAKEGLIDTRSAGHAYARLEAVLGGSECISDCNGCAALRAKLEEVENRHADTCTRMAEEHRRAITALTEPHADCKETESAGDREDESGRDRRDALRYRFLRERHPGAPYIAFDDPATGTEGVPTWLDIADNVVERAMGMNPTHARGHSVCPGDGKPCTEGCREVCRFNPAMPCNRERTET